MYMLLLLDTYAPTYAVLVIALCECIAVAWVYGRSNFTLWPPASSLADGHYILLLMFLSSYLLFFIRRLISEVSGPIVTKLCHMFDGDCNF